MFDMMWDFCDQEKKNIKLESEGYMVRSWMDQTVRQGMLGVSQTTIQRIISVDLEGKVRKKYMVHRLSNAMIQQRLARGPGF
ncbi:hypothetical protein BV898_11339 [Hypsibius exemplaris]|uniref:Uncharacterized protein n=1 Tax=Hypsibius exemplaris TaxID=2072580 RepID=A0A1W0WH26_HYPEX|nr:hypothetical protein BV898_11339 [Hypsibius exemplaris]